MRRPLTSALGVPGSLAALHRRVDELHILVLALQGFSGVDDKFPNLVAAHALPVGQGLS